MTKRKKKYANLTCKWCGTPLTRKSNNGPPPKYCKGSHRQRAYEARKYGMHNIRAAGKPRTKQPVKKDDGRTSEQRMADMLKKAVTK